MGFKSIVILFFCCFIVDSVQAQCQLNSYAENIINETGMKLQNPEGYSCDHFFDCCVQLHPDYLQSIFNFYIENKKRNIMINFGLRPYPKPTTRALKFLIETQDLNKPSMKALAVEADTTLSKVIYIDTLQLKKVNADCGIIYNLKIGKLPYMSKYTRCKKLELYKDNVGRAEMYFFYSEGDDALVDEEIKKTWGMLKFKS